MLMLLQKSPQNYEHLHTDMRGVKEACHLIRVCGLTWQELAWPECHDLASAYLRMFTMPKLERLPYLSAVDRALQRFQLVVLPAHGILLKLQKSPIVQICCAHCFSSWRRGSPLLHQRCSAGTRTASEGLFTLGKVLPIHGVLSQLHEPQFISSIIPI